MTLPTLMTITATMLLFRDVYASTGCLTKHCSCPAATGRLFPIGTFTAAGN